VILSSTLNLFHLQFWYTDSFIPIQTSSEEYIFRGYLMVGFANLANGNKLLDDPTIFGGIGLTV
jgi:membrane protease YdiL (CAAX protease family)